MRTLVIPDVHHRWVRAQVIIDREQADHVVHLGDHQDNHGDIKGDAVATAHWTKSRLDAGDTILLGNHDLPYWFYHHLHECPGWDAEKHRAIQPILSPEDRRKLRLWVEVEGWLLSHAGFPSYHSGHIHEEQYYLEKLWAGRPDPLIYASRGRMQRDAIDGVLWLDWDDFVPLIGIRQIVGHTPAPMPRRKWALGGMANIALDTNLKHYAVIEDGVVTVKSERGTVLW